MKIFFLLIICPFLTFGKTSYVTCAFKGQLGNQMFQIAATIAYALDHGFQPIFPDLLNAHDGQFHYQTIFNQLNIESSIDEDYSFYRESEHTHYVKYLPIPLFETNICLDGYFQSYKYFSHHIKTIQTYFSPPNCVIAEIEQKYKALLAGPTVAVHIRTFIPDNRKPQLFLNYFMEAFAYFPENYTLVVFSDFIEWAKSHFPNVSNKVVFIEGNSHIVDFYLMTRCDHQIVFPGSTFSWWAAYLNENPQKIVIAPDQWAGRFDTDIILDSWIKIPVR